MRAVGGILLILSALALSVFLEKGEKRRIRELCALTDFLARAEREIGIYGRPMAEIIASFENETLHNLGFYEAAAGGDLLAGVRAVTERGALTEGELSPLLLPLSKGLPPVAADAAALLRAAREELSRTREFYEKEAPRTVRLFRVVAGAGTAIAVLLLL